MLSTVQELEEKTQAFWMMSLAWNGKSLNEIPTGEAIIDCTDIIDSTNPVRPIFHAADRLMQEIIQGEGSAPPSESKLIPFAAPVKKQKRAFK